MGSPRLIIITHSGHTHYEELSSSKDHKVLQKILIPYKLETLYSGNLPSKNVISHFGHLSRILSSAARKANTRK